MNYSAKLDEPSFDISKHKKVSKKMPKTKIGSRNLHKSVLGANG